MQPSSKKNLFLAAVSVCMLLALGLARTAEAGLLSGVDPIHSYFAQNDPLAQYDPVMQFLFGKDKTPTMDQVQSAINEATPAYCDAVAGQIAALQAAAKLLVAQYTTSQKELIAATNEYNELVGSSTSASSLFSATTASSGVQATTTAQVTETTVATSSQLSMFITPASASIGDLMTVNMNVTSPSITHYSLLTYQDSRYIGMLINNSLIPGTSTRPFAFTKTFRLSPLTPSAAYDFTLEDAQNASTFATSRLTVVAGSAASGTVAFTQPWASGLMHRNAPNLITWNVSGNTTSALTLSAVTSCVRKVTFCPNSPSSSQGKACSAIQSACKAGVSKTISIASGISPSQGSFAWTVPSSIVDVTARITAVQNGKVVGRSPSFYISY